MSLEVEKKIKNSL